jgi:hypothetical protein
MKVFGPDKIKLSAIERYASYLEIIVLLAFHSLYYPISRMKTLYLRFLDITH